MKTICLAMLVSCWATIAGPTCATEGNLAFPQQSSDSAAKTGAAQGSNTQDAPLTAPGKTSGEQENPDTSENQRSSRADLARANHHKQPATNPRGLIAREATKLHQPSVTASTGAVNQPPATTELHSQARPVRPSRAIPDAQPSPKKDPHRGANPASIGGDSAPNTQGLGSINGTRVSRKP